MPSRPVSAASGHPLRRPGSGPLLTFRYGKGVFAPTRTPAGSIEPHVAIGTQPKRRYTSWVGLPNGLQCLMNAPASLLLFAIVGALVSGCGTWPLVSENRDRVAAPEHFPGAFQSMLSHEPAGTSAHLEQSPWGENVGVVLHPPYHAASGRICRDVTVSSNGMRRPALVCERRDGTWEPVRLLHVDGRPALGVRKGLPAEGRVR